MRPAVLGVLRKFIPGFLATDPPLSREQHRAIWAILHCRTSAMGGSLYVCPDCGKEHFAYYSCNHRACPQCGATARQQWVQRELNKLVEAPYFMVTFTVPQELRHCFFGGASAKLFYDIFFGAAAGALKEKLATAKGFKAEKSGFIAMLHTWNQQLNFHPHLHFLVPGVGLNNQDQVVRVRKSAYLIHLPLLQAAFREHFRRLLRDHNWTVDSAVWSKPNWGIHIQACGSGRAVLKYLGLYVARTAIADSRIVEVTTENVTFRWKDRTNGGMERLLRIPGVEFVRRYLRHVLPHGLRSIRYYGFCHPAAIRQREKLRSGLGMTSQPPRIVAPPHDFSCSQCQAVIRPIGRLRAFWHKPTRGPPTPPIHFTKNSC